VVYYGLAGGGGDEGVGQWGNDARGGEVEG